MYINSILSIEATFVNITFQSSKQKDLIDTLSVPLSHTRRNRSNLINFLKSEAFLTDSTNIAMIGTIEKVTTEKKPCGSTFTKTL